MFNGIIIMYIYILLLLACVLCVFCALEREILFEKDSVIVDVLCPKADITFGITKSAIFCSVLCQSDSVCASLFFDQASKECYGATTTVSSTTDCVARQGMVYYKKRVSSDYGRPCTINNDCPSTYTECSNGVCRCVAGAPYDQNSGRCLSSCVNYGLSYTGYTGMAFSITSIITVDGVTTPQECEQHCSSTSGCVAFNYAPSLDKCRPMDRTPLSEPSSYGPHSVVNHYTRNCA